MKRIDMPCPACTHERKFYSEKWTHAVCGGVLDLDDNAFVHCRACGKKAHITTMYMSCSKHKLVKPTQRQIASAISTGRMCMNEDSAEWLIRILKKL